MIGVREIIKNALFSLESYSRVNMSAVYLVEMTFLMQTEMETIYNERANPVSYGLMGMSKQELKTFINDRVKANQRWADDINNIALVDVFKDSIDDVIEAVSYNIALQSLLVFFIYLDRAKDMPEGMPDVISTYFNYWPTAPKQNEANRKKAVDLMSDWTTRLQHGSMYA